MNSRHGMNLDLVKGLPNIPNLGALKLYMHVFFRLSPINYHQAADSFARHGSSEGVGESGHISTRRRGRHVHMDKGRTLGYDLSPKNTNCSTSRFNRLIKVSD